MQVGKVEVGPGWRGGSTALPMSQTDQDKLREKRNLGLRKMKTLGLVTVILSVLTLVVGIVTVVIAARGPAGWPVFNFGPAIVGILMIFTGFLALSAGRQEPDLQNTDVENTPRNVKCKFVAHYVLSVTCISLCSIAGVFGFLTAGICSGDSGSLVKNCYPDKAANIALGVIGGLLCVILAILCIVVCVFFCIYARSFGFKNRYERAMEYQMGVMMRAMQEQQQQQGQFQGQPMQGQGQWGQYGSQFGGQQGGQFSAPPPPYR